MADTQLQTQYVTPAVSKSNTEEWTTSRKIVNHTTRQVETRVKRKIVMEDGKVIADSGPQITSRTREDNKTEEFDNSNKKALPKAGDGPPGPGFLKVPDGTTVVSEKIENHTTMREAKEENMQFHDESFQELTGYDVHQKALVAPNELVAIKDESSDEDDRGREADVRRPLFSRPPRGKMVHYSAKSKRVSDAEEVKETSKLDRTGNLTTETTRTCHHEEEDNDEVPEEVQNMRQLSTADRPLALPASTEPITPRDEPLTDRWVESHFGSSDHLNVSEERTTRTSAGGNVINIEMTSSRKPLKASTRTPSPAQERSSSAAGRYTPLKATPLPYRIVESPITPTKAHREEYSHHRTEHHSSRHLKDHHVMSPSPQPYYYTKPVSEMHTRSVPFKEDASVQASFSEDSDSDSDDSIHGRGHRRSTPARSYYFGSEADPNRHTILNESSSSLNKKNAYNATYHQRTTSTKLEDIGRRSPSPTRPSSSSDRVMFHQVAYDPNGTTRSNLSKKNAEFRQRPSALSPPPPPSPLPALIRPKTTSRRSNSPSISRSPSPRSKPQSNNDTFTKSKGKMVSSSLSRRSPSPSLTKSKFPDLKKSPSRDRNLSIANLRIGSTTGDMDRELPGSRSSSRLVEVRGWENRP